MRAADPFIEPLRDLTAADAFLAVRTMPHPVWLDSVILSSLGRFSFIAVDPILVIKSKHSTVHWEGDGFEMTMCANPFTSLGDWLSRVQPPNADKLPFPPGAAIGFFGYELKNQLEKLPQRAANDIRLPEMWWGIYDVLVVFDHAQNESWLISSGLTPQGIRDSRLAKERAQSFSKKLTGAISRLMNTPTTIPVLSPLHSNFTRDEYLAAVQRAKDYIAAGDVYQINLSQRFESRSRATLNVDENVALYFRLRQSNPAAFAAFLDIGEATILSSSPECFLDITDRTVRTFPIKGTRPRGATPAEDARLARELAASRKDHAELVMIVDLERNDLGRVCQFGSVHVPDLARIESYSTVHHLVATVEGTLRKGVSHLDCVRACFPGGSITGTPKIRAMEIIDALEPHTRGVYTGAIGMLGLPDAAGRQQTKLNIAIRTITLTADRALFHSGGGIVADSDPVAEYEETLHKARGIMMALGVSP